MSDERDDPVIKILKLLSRLVPTDQVFDEDRRLVGKAIAIQKAQALDAKRYRFIRNNINCGLHLSHNGDHLANYDTAKQWIEEIAPYQFSDTSLEEIKKMKDTNTIWSLQIYPKTPVGFNHWHSSTLDGVIDEALAALDEVKK